MFKSLDRQTQKEIIIIDPYWDEITIMPLRERGRDDCLTCPVCKQPVHVKAGKKKRWHFAHKDLSNCPLKHESPNILKARSLLYTWLKIKHGEKVTVEKFLPDSDLPRPIDCYVQISSEQKIGYWILERGVRDRYSLQRIFDNFNISIRWVLLSDMLKTDDEDPEAVHLTPTERDFTYSSDYNQLYSHHDRALCYLNIDDHMLVTLRGLNCIHLPQKYHFEFKLEDDLNQMLFSPTNGEFVHPGEYERLEELRRQIIEQERLREIEERKRQEKMRERQKEINRQQQIVLKQAASSKPLVSFNTKPLSSNKPIKREAEKQESQSYLDKPYPCRICGTMTANWTTLDLGDHTCVCSRECLEKSRKDG